MSYSAGPGWDGRGVFSSARSSPTPLHCEADTEVEGQAIEREAHLSARLEHPGIARIYSVTWTEEALALVGEWVRWLSVE